MGFENSGRRPRVSTAVQRLRGNPGKRRLITEVSPPAGVVEKPAWLSPGAAVVWDELSPICREMGTLTRADRRAFSMLCELEATGMQTYRARKDAALVRRQLQCAAMLRTYYALFGLDPLSRSRIQAPSAAADSPWIGKLA